MDLFCFCFVLCLLCLCARLFICALWSPAGKGLTSWFSFVVSAVSLICHFPIGILGQVWYLIVSIPDLCTLTYFHYTGAGFSGLSFSFSFSTRHHRKSSISLNMQCVTRICTFLC